MKRLRIICANHDWKGGKGYVLIDNDLYNQINNKLQLEKNLSRCYSGFVMENKVVKFLTLDNLVKFKSFKKNEFRVESLSVKFNYLPEIKEYSGIDSQGLKKFSWSHSTLIISKILNQFDGIELIEGSSLCNLYRKADLFVDIPEDRLERYEDNSEEKYD